MTRRTHQNCSPNDENDLAVHVFNNRLLDGIIAIGVGVKVTRLARHQRHAGKLATIPIRHHADAGIGNVE